MRSPPRGGSGRNPCFVLASDCRIGDEVVSSVSRGKITLNHNFHKPTLTPSAAVYLYFSVSCCRRFKPNQTKLNKRKQPREVFKNAFVDFVTWYCTDSRLDACLLPTTAVPVPGACPHLFTWICPAGYYERWIHWIVLRVSLVWLRPPPIIGAQYSVCESVRRSQGHKEKHQRAERVSCPRPRESLTIMELRAATGISVSLHHFGPPQAARYVDEGGFAYRNRHVDTEAR